MTPSSEDAYREAGVDLRHAEAVVEIAKQASARTRMPHVLGGVGGFSAAFEIPPHYRNPVLLTACDGVGTKLKLAFESGKHRNIGIDLVAMNVNDILANGGQPLVFLDYIATEAIEPQRIQEILEGIAKGCEMACCALVGGETAEMPGFYQPNEYDLAGFCVGVVEKERMYPRHDRLGEGDVLIGLASSGLHSNGFSLVRKILFQNYKMTLTTPVPELGGLLQNILLEPTRIYVKPVLRMLNKFPDAVHGMVHITGGGLYDNVARMLTPTTAARLFAFTWEGPPVFEYIQKMGSLPNESMWHTFNCGLGFVMAVNKNYADAVRTFLDEQTEEKSFVVGEIIAAKPDTPRVSIE